MIEYFIRRDQWEWMYVPMALVYALWLYVGYRSPKVINYLVEGLNQLLSFAAFTSVPFAVILAWKYHILGLVLVTLGAYVAAFQIENKGLRKFIQCVLLLIFLWFYLNRGLPA